MNNESKITEQAAEIERLNLVVADRNATICKLMGDAAKELAGGAAIPAGGSDAIRTAAQEVLNHRKGTLPVCGWLLDNDASRKALQDLADAVAAPVVSPRPTDDALWDQTMRDRDTYHEWADKLAGAIAKHFGTDIGEHSNMNCPWAEALDAIEAIPSLPVAVQQPSSLTNGEIRTIMHKYSRYMGQPGYYSDTEFACLQDVVAFAKEVGRRSAALPVAEHPTDSPLTEDEQLALMVKVEDYMSAVDWAGTQTHEKCDAAESNIIALVNGIITNRAAGVPVAERQDQGVALPAAVGEWVSVEDRLPEAEMSVLVMAPEWERPCIAAHFPGDEFNRAQWQDDSGEEVEPAPTNWMPLPDTPAAPSTDKQAEGL